MAAAEFGLSRRAATAEGRGMAGVVARRVTRRAAGHKFLYSRVLSFRSLIGSQTDLRNQARVGSRLVAGLGYGSHPWISE